jgi:hypothetical protein
MPVLQDQKVFLSPGVALTAARPPAEPASEDSPWSDGLLVHAADGTIFRYDRAVAPRSLWDRSVPESEVLRLRLIAWSLSGQADGQDQSPPIRKVTNLLHLQNTR